MSSNSIIIGDFGGHITLMLGYSESIDIDLNTGQNVVGNSWDDTYMYYSRYPDGIIYQCLGFSLSINAQFSIHGNGLRGISIDQNGNVISVNRNTDTVYLHVGVSSSISNSFVTPGLDEHGATWTGTDCIVMNRDGVANKSMLYLMTGFSGSVSAFFILTAAADKSGRDTTWDGNNVYSTDISNATMTKFVGFSSAVDSTLNTPYGNPNGTAWFNAAGRFGEDVGGGARQFSNNFNSGFYQEAA